MKTISFLLVALFAASCAATVLTERELELQQFILRAQRENQLDGILRQMMFQHNNKLPEEITKVLRVSNIAIPSAVIQQAPTNSKYRFKGMEKLSANEMRAVTVFLDEYFQKRDEELAKFQPKKMDIRVPRKSCNVDDDCPFQQFCFDISEELFKEMSKKGYVKHYQMAMTILGINNKECSPRFADLMVNDVESYMLTLRSAFDKIHLVLEKSERINGMQFWLNEVKVKLMKPFNFTKFVEKPLATVRQGFMPNAAQQQYYYQPQPQPQAPAQGYGPQYFYYPQQQPAVQAPAQDDSSMLLILLLLGQQQGSDNNMQQLLPLLLLMGDGGMGGGMGGDLSPLLLISVLGMGDGNLFSNGNNLMTILLLTSVMGGSGGGGGDGFILPLLLIMMQNQSSIDNNMLLFLPLLLGGFGDSTATARSGHFVQCPPGGGQNQLVTLLLFTSLLNVSGSGSGNSLNTLLLLSVLQPQQGCPGQDLGLLPILLIQSMNGGSGNVFLNGSSLLPLLLLGGLGSGGSGQIDPTLLLLTLLPNQNNNNDMMSSLLPILFLSDPNFSQDPLVFLLLFNNNLFGGSGNNGGGLLGGNSNLLFLLLFLGGGSSGYASQPITSPYGITQPVANIPQPGGAPYVQQQPGVQTTTQSGGFLGLGGDPLITFVLLSNVIGGGSLGSNEILLFILLSSGGGGLF